MNLKKIIKVHLHDPCLHQSKCNISQMLMWVREVNFCLSKHVQWVSLGFKCKNQTATHGNLGSICKTLTSPQLSLLDTMFLWGQRLTKNFLGFSYFQPKLNFTQLALQTWALVTFPNPLGCHTG